MKIPRDLSGRAVIARSSANTGTIAKSIRRVVISSCKHLLDDTARSLATTLLTPIALCRLKCSQLLFCLGNHLLQPRRGVRYATPPDPAAFMLAEHPYVRSARPKESVQNVRARAVIAAIAPESGPNCHWLPPNIRCRTCAAQHMGGLSLGEHSKCVARVRARIVAGFVARYVSRCFADRVISASRSSRGTPGADPTWYGRRRKAGCP